MIRDSSQTQIWHLTDILFKKPKVHMVFQFACPEAYVSPKSSVMTSLFVGLASDSLNEDFIYNAEVAGLRYGIF